MNNLSQCRCISQDDKETLTNIIDDAISMRRESYESTKSKAIRELDQNLLKDYEKFSDLISNFKTC